MTLIDLGEVHHGVAAPAAPPGLRHIGRTALAVIAVLAVLLPGGSARPVPAAVRPLWTTDVQEQYLALSADTAYVRRGTSADGAELVAYDLATGTQRWRFPTPRDVVRIAAEPDGGPVLVAGQGVVRFGSDSSATYIATTIALDPVTGAERWRTPGEVGTTDDAGNALLVEFGGRDSLVPVRLRMIRVADGRERWRLALSGVTGWAVTQHGGFHRDVATVDATGRIRVYGYDDGVLRRSGRVPWDPAQSYVMAAGPHIAVRQDEEPGANTAVYRTSDLSTVWDSAGRPGYLTPCGTLLCFVDGGGVTATDPATGAERWFQPGMRGVRELSPDRILLDDARPDGTLLLVDTATGRPLGEPFAGTPLWNPAGRPVLILDRTLTPPARTTVTELDPATGERQLLGVTTKTIDMQSCTAGGRYLACIDEGTMTVTAAG